MVYRFLNRLDKILLFQTHFFCLNKPIHGAASLWFRRSPAELILTNSAVSRAVGLLSAGSVLNSWIGDSAMYVHHIAIIKKIEILEQSLAGVTFRWEIGDKILEMTGKQSQFGFHCPQRC